MRHTFASLLLQNRVPITYVSRQLGHKDASITLKVYAHWMSDPSTEKLVDALDDTATGCNPRATSGVGGRSGKSR
jgi:integrase